MPFDSLCLDAPLVRAAAELGFTTPTPIQQAAIPAVLAGHDVLATAQTGSGKTAAFALPVLQRLLAGMPPDRRRTRALVLVPTRELAAQVGETVRALGQHAPHRLKTAVVFGGVSINPQMMALRGGADIVVATPGRLLDLVVHNALRLDAVHTLVLDEADRLFDLGFADELARILALLPARRQNLLFSATFAPAIAALAADLLHEPIRIDLTPESVRSGVSPEDACAGAPPGGGSAPAIVQRVIEVDAARRTQLLLHLIRTEKWERVLVFVASRHAAERVAAKLHKAGVYVTPFHGKVAQGTRADILAEFRDSRWDVVVATDLAARGLDIAGLPVVVSYDLARSPVDHVHRIGRTGRAGAAGLAVSFVSPETDAHFRLIEKRQGLSLPREHIEGFEPTETATPGTVGVQGEPGTGGIKGKRPSKKDKLRAAAALAAARGE